MESIERSMLTDTIGKWFIICKKNESVRVTHFLDAELPSFFYQITTPESRLERYPYPRRPTENRKSVVSTYAKKLRRMYNTQDGEPLFKESPDKISERPTKRLHVTLTDKTEEFPPLPKGVEKINQLKAHQTWEQNKNKRVDTKVKEVEQKLEELQKKIDQTTQIMHEMQTSIGTHIKTQVNKVLNKQIQTVVAVLDKRYKEKQDKREAQLMEILGQQIGQEIAHHRAQEKCLEQEEHKKKDEQFFAKIQAMMNNQMQQQNGLGSQDNASSSLLKSVGAGAK
eukprot:7981567-Ditylum_brightwellii.AAC.1